MLEVTNFWMAIEVLGCYVSKGGLPLEQERGGGAVEIGGGWRVSPLTWAVTSESHHWPVVDYRQPLLRTRSLQSFKQSRTLCRCPVRWTHQKQNLKFAPSDMHSHTMCTSYSFNSVSITKKSILLLVKKPFARLFLTALWFGADINVSTRTENICVKHEI